MNKKKKKTQHILLSGQLQNDRKIVNKGNTDKHIIYYIHNIERGQIEKP